MAASAQSYTIRFGSGDRSCPPLPSGKEMDGQQRRLAKAARSCYQEVFRRVFTQKEQQKPEDGVLTLESGDKTYFYCPEKCALSREGLLVILPKDHSLQEEKAVSEEEKEDPTHRAHLIAQLQLSQTESLPHWTLNLQERVFRERVGREMNSFSW